MVDISKVKPGDILYTIHDVWDYEMERSIGRVSICVKEVIDSETHPVLAHGQICYRAEDLTDVRPAYDEYHHYGEGFAALLARQDNEE